MKDAIVKIHQMMKTTTMTIAIVKSVSAGVKIPVTIAIAKSASRSASASVISVFSVSYVPEQPEPLVLQVEEVLLELLELPEPLEQPG